MGYSNEDIEDFFENAASALHWVDSRGVILRANKYELDTLGYEHDEYVGHHITEFHADPEVIADILGRLGRNETLRDYEASLRAKDGSIRHVLINSNVRWSEDGEFLHTRCFTQDVTDRKLAQQALAETMADLERKVAERTSELESANRELERHRQQLVEAQRIGQFGSWDWDVASSDVTWSQELHQIFGLPEDVVPTHAAFVALIHPEDKEVRLAALERGMRSEEPFAYEVRIIRPDGDLRFLHVRAATTFGPDGDPVRLVGTAQDVTESKLAAEERQLFEARWQEAQRLESLGMLAGGIAHDFNNLLVGVLGNASLALSDLPPDSPARTGIEGVELAARRAGELTQQLLAYSGQGSFVVQPLDLAEVVSEMGHLLETVVSKKVRLDYEFGVKRPVVEIDATQFRQVVMNLIVNAAEACGDRQGRIVVRTSIVDADRSYLDTFVVADDREGEYALLEVSDTGSGMSADTQAKIFDPFFTTKSTGRGLGLAGVLGIVRAQGGAVRVKSEPGHGSTVDVLLPLSVAPLPKPISGPKNTLPKGQGMILVADDERVIRDVAGAMLTRAGFTVVSACDGDEAVALFTEKKDEVDAVILDLMMPGRGGADVLRELRAIRRDLPVVVSSGYAAEALDGTLDTVGEVGFVQKPYTSSQLVGAVQEALAVATR